jgi:hypothetical protein
MKVSVTEFVKDKVFFFLAPDIQKEEIEKFKELVRQWMDKRVQNYSSPWHSEFVTYLSDGRIAIISIVDVNKDVPIVPYDIELN